MFQCLFPANDLFLNMLQIMLPTPHQHACMRTIAAVTDSRQSGQIWSSTTSAPTGRCAAMAGSGAAGLRPALLAALAVVVDYAAQQASSQVRARSPFRCWS